MGHGAATAPFQRQAWLGSIQRLNLALFIDTKHQSLFGRIQIQPDHIGEFLREAGGTRKFESLGAMRLNLMALPDPIDRGLADAVCLGHAAATPMRGADRTRLQRLVDNRRHLVGEVAWLTPTTLCHFPKTIGSLAEETGPPKSNGLGIDLQFIGHFLVLASSRGGQDDATA